MPPANMRTSSAATAAQDARDDKKNVANIVAAVGLYWAVSLCMVFANKTLLGGADLRTAPMFITFFQCLVTVIFCYVGPRIGVPGMPPFEVRSDLVKGMLPLSLVFTAMIVTNNLTLKYVEVSFYQIARSLTIVFNVIFDFVVLGQRTSMPAIGCCAMVVSGFLLGNQQEIRWSLIGVIFGVTSSFFVAMNAIYVKKKFALVDNNPWKITLYNNVNATLLFLPLIVLSGEVPIILESPTVRTLNFWLLMSVGGLLGVSISFATAAQIKYTSPLTHNVSATAKAAAQTVIALMVYRNPITSLGALSVAIVLGGSMCYTLVRRGEMRRKSAADNAERDAAVAAAEDKRPLLSSSNGSK
jgi:solute carrier family 35 (GDP-fucose transporter), member C1